MAKEKQSEKVPEFMKDETQNPGNNPKQTSSDIPSIPSHNPDNNYEAYRRHVVESKGEKSPTVLSDVCPVCMGHGPFEKCLITKTHIDQNGYGFEGLICPDCGIIRIAKRKDGKFIYGFEQKFHLQE
jgi:hypothetical protein